MAIPPESRVWQGELACSGICATASGGNTEATSAAVAPVAAAIIAANIAALSDRFFTLPVSARIEAFMRDGPVAPSRQAGNLKVGRRTQSNENKATTIEIEGKRSCWD